MELIQAFFDLIKAFWEVFVLIAQFQVEMNDFIGSACGQADFICGLFGIWIAIRTVLLGLGIFFWSRLSDRDMRFIL